MGNSHHSSDINTTDKLPVHAVFVIGTATVAVLDKSIVEKLGINEESFFQQELTNDGIVLRLFRIDGLSQHTC